MSFNFGAAPLKTPATTGFALGGGDIGNKGLSLTASTASAGRGISFGQPATAVTSTANFGLSAALTGQPQNFGFAPASSSGFGSGTAAPEFKPAATTTTQSGLNLGSIATSQPQAPSFGLGSTAPQIQPASTGFNLGGAIPQTTGFRLPSTVAPSQAPSFNLGALSTQSTATTTSAAPATLNFGTGAIPKTTAQAAFPAITSTLSTGLSGFPFGSTATTTAATSTPSALGAGLSFGAPATTSSTSLSLPSTTTSAVSAALTFSSTTTATTSALTSANQTATASASSGQTFSDLEKSINKWTLELEEQEKLFMNQALQLNAWDRLLITNGEKVLELNTIVERVKEEQQQLEHELDFTVAQQRELEECIAPLEKELANIPVTDHDRQRTYQLAEHMDSQLKQLSEDLKEIIEHLNETSRAEDSSDPIVQIGRILNAHMNSLQWIDRNTALISSQLDQITKLHETHRREQERSFHLIYE